MFFVFLVPFSLPFFFPIQFSASICYNVSASFTTNRKIKNNKPEKKEREREVRRRKK